MRFLGIDVGAHAFHCVVIDEERKVVEGRVLEPETGAMAAFAVDAAVIAIDAPASPAPRRTQTTAPFPPSSNQHAAARSPWGASARSGYLGSRPSPAPIRRSGCRSAFACTGRLPSMATSRSRSFPMRVFGRSPGGCWQRRPPRPAFDNGSTCWSGRACGLPTSSSGRTTDLMPRLQR